MSDLKLEAGKTYVFIDDDARRGFVEGDAYNSELLEDYYKDGFKLSGVGGDGHGYVDGLIIMDPSETKYFKLKETKMKATDIVNVEMTALDAFKLKGLMGKTNSGAKTGSLFATLTKMTTENILDSTDTYDVLNWKSDSKLTRWALSQFEPEKNRAAN